MEQPVPPVPAKGHLWGRLGRGTGWHKSSSQGSLGFTLLPMLSGSGHRAGRLSSPSDQLRVGTWPAFPRDAWADERGGSFPGFLTAVTSPTETSWAAVLPSLHEQDALHHHMLGKARSSATCRHKGSSKPAPPAAQDSLSLVLLLSKVTSKAPFPH